MTATLNLTVEQAEAVLSGVLGCGRIGGSTHVAPQPGFRQRYVRVPMVEEVVAQEQWSETIHAHIRVPDSSWVAAAKPTTVQKWNIPEEIEKVTLNVEPTCETCDGEGVIAVDLGLDDLDFDTHPCPACGGSGVPQVTVTAPCPTFRPMCNRIGPNFGRPDHKGCPDCLDGRVSVGFVRVVGPLLEVVRWGKVDGPCVVVIYPESGHPMRLWLVDGLDADRNVIVQADISDQLPFLAPDPDSLIGCWVAAVEVLA